MSDEPQRHPENESAIEGFALNIRWYTVVYYETTKPEYGGTGVLIEVDGRVFVATAAHCLLPRDPNGRVTLIARKECNVEEGMLEILSYGRGPQEGDRTPRPDVAFFELRPKDVTEFLEKAPITLDRIQLAGTGNPGKMAFTFGYPQALQTPHRISEGKDMLAFKAGSYGNPPLPFDKWPEVPPDSAPADVNFDVFTRYSLTEPVIEIGGSTDGRLPKPTGLSGGGIWQSDWTPGDGKVWSPDILKLFAIQSSWYQRHEYLRGTQIQHWLNLLCQKCPELIPAVEEGVKGYRYGAPK